ncbi:SIR2 family protein [Bacillus paranthracis]|nr:SIR2 family protein [Bacillus paranthracis]
MQPPYKRYLERGEYLKALEYLQEHSIITTEADIKEEILKNFSRADIKSAFSTPNNYLDLFNLKSEFYITTNYDNALTSIATKLGPFTLPYTLADLTDLPVFLRENRQRVLHIHGNIEKPETMIVTKNDYESLYNGNKIVQMLLAIMGNKSFLFLGFSFQDEFFKNLYLKIISQIQGNHFIIMPNISLSDAKLLSQNNLKVIGINVETDEQDRYVMEDYVQGIRTILKQLF